MKVQALILVLLVPWFVHAEQQYYGTRVSAMALSGTELQGDLQVVRIHPGDVITEENIRSSINVADRGRTMMSEEDAHDLAKLALAETGDALKVLSQGALAASTEADILSARANLFVARVLLQIGQDAPLRAVGNVLQQATTRLRAARFNLADPGTLPVSYGN